MPNDTPSNSNAGNQQNRSNNSHRGSQPNNDSARSRGYDGARSRRYDDSRSNSSNNGGTRSQDNDESDSVVIQSCLRCFRVTHTTRDCPSLHRYRGLNLPFCDRCHNYGHETESCRPENSRSYTFNRNQRTITINNSSVQRNPGIRGVANPQSGLDANLPEQVSRSQYPNLGRPQIIPDLAELRTIRQFGELIEFPYNLMLDSPTKLSLATYWILCCLIEDFETERVNTGEWFHFIFIVFKTVRRRIVQFKYDDLEAAHLLEIITRFHIFVSHRMCHYPPDTGFTEKLNYQNLSISLSMIIHAFDDLYNRQIYCEDEAEFRAYYLLYFPRINITYDVSKFSPEVRNSPQVKFAVECLIALQTNNYFNFFKLIRKADYMSAAILHRYFYDVRIGAFNVIVKTHGDPKYPKVDLIRLLGFEDSNELDEYLDHIGLKHDRSNVFLDKKLTLNSKRPSKRVSKILIECRYQDKDAVQLISAQKVDSREIEAVLELTDTGGYKFNAAFDDLVDDDDGKLEIILSVAEEIWKSIFFKEVSNSILKVIDRIFKNL